MSVKPYDVDPNDPLYDPPPKKNKGYNPDRDRSYPFKNPVENQRMESREDFNPDENEPTIFDAANLGYELTKDGKGQKMVKTVGNYINETVR